jgi:outer membrane murein-binding lipoprotein Lpp
MMMVVVLVLVMGGINNQKVNKQLSNNHLKAKVKREAAKR